MHALTQFCLDLVKFGVEPFLHRGPTNHELPFPTYTTVVGKPKEVEGLWFLPPLKTPAVSSRKAPETD